MNPIGGLATVGHSANVAEVPSEVRNFKELKAKTEQLVEAVTACDWEETSNLSRSLLLAGRGDIGLMVNQGSSINPLPIAVGLFKALGKPELKCKGELKHSIARAARVFLEVSYMKCVMQGESPLSAKTREELSEIVEHVQQSAQENEVGLYHELKCSAEALEEIDRPNFVDFLKQLREFVSGFSLGHLPSLLEGLLELHQSSCQGWFREVLYVSWVGSLTHTNLEIFKSLKGLLKAQLDEKQVALSAVELYGTLIWNGSMEVALEALGGEGGLLNLINHGHSKWRKNQKWKVRYRVTQILAALYAHPDELIVSQVNKALLDRRLKEGNKQVKALLKQYEENIEIANRWKQLYEETKTTIIQEEIQNRDSLIIKRQQFKQKEKELNHLEERLSLVKPSQNRQDDSLQQLVHALKQDLDQRSQEIADLPGELEAYRDNLQSFQLLTTVDNYHAALPSSAPDTSSSASTSTQSTGKELEEMEFGKLESLAHQGLPAAERELGKRFMIGKGTNKDPKLAFQWIQKGALQGHAPSQNTLGYCYCEGIGTEVNWDEVVKWYRLAAEQGEARAQCNLGHCYKKGQGVARNIEEAVKWLRLAAQQGHARAQKDLGLCYYKGQGVQQSFEEAVKWYRLAAEQGVAVAQYDLGNCLVKGQGVQQSFEEAEKWFRLAADQDHVGAQCNLGYCLEMGQGVEERFEEAAMWYRLAAEQDHADAQCYLGYCLEMGQGVQQSFEKAVKWYRLAADQGNKSAQDALKRLDK